MSTPTTTLTPEDTRAFEPRYGALVVNDDLTVAIDELFETRYRRRDAVIKTLLDLYPEVTQAEVDEILVPFGGATPDVALNKVIALFSDLDTPLDIHLSAHLVDIGPMTLHSTFTDYGTGEVTIEHYESKDDLLAALRVRAADIVNGNGDVLREDFYDTSDEEECVRIIVDFISPTNGCLHVMTAARQMAGSGYLGYYASEG